MNSWQLVSGYWTYKAMKDKWRWFTLCTWVEKDKFIIKHRGDTF